MRKVHVVDCCFGGWLTLGYYEKALHCEVITAPVFLFCAKSFQRADHLRKSLKIGTPINITVTVLTLRVCCAIE